MENIYFLLKKLPHDSWNSITSCLFTYADQYIHEETAPLIKTVQFSVLYAKKLVFLPQSMDCVADALYEEILYSNSWREIDQDWKPRNVSQSLPFCNIKHIE